MIAHEVEVRNAPPLGTLTDQLVALVRTAAEQGQPIHEVERDIWDHVRALGRAALSQYVRMCGTGDVGPQVALPDGTSAQRLERTHTRTYRSVFGNLNIERTVYGSREGQAIAFVPLDNRMQLPASDYSYLLQEWDQMFVAESAFNRVSGALERILDIEQSVDSLEGMNRQMARSVEAFRDARPMPEPGTEGAVFVASADGKGIVMQRDAADPAPKAHRGKGDKANKKRMAIVGAVYSVGLYLRTADEVVAALFRDRARDADTTAARPEPVGKHVWGRLSRAPDGSLGEPIGAVFGWLRAELGRRNPGAKPVVCVMDGQECLWDGCREYLPTGAVEVLDLLHVAPRLWQAAHLFHNEGSAEATGFVRDRLRRVLEGESRSVVIGLRRMGTTTRLCSGKRTRLETICRYLIANESRMRYDEYLAKGYPIASGVIEGACRSYVKDRMERSGMKWTKTGAQAMLDVRSEYLNGDWEAFQTFRVEAETERLYPNRTILPELNWQLSF